MANQFVHLQQRRFALSRIPQTNFATVTAAVTTPPLAYEYLLVKDQGLADYEINTKNNDGYSTGNDFLSESWTLTHDVTRQFEMDVASDPIGRFFYGLCGADVITQPDAILATTAYQHVFTPQDANTSRQLPAYSYIEQVGDAIDNKFPSMIVESFEISGDAEDRITASAMLHGSGKRTSPSVINFSGGSNHVKTLSGLVYFFNTQISFVRSDYSTLANAKNYSTGKLFENWSVKFSNELLADDGYRPGSTDFQTAGDPTSGAIRSEMLFGKRTIEASAQVRVNSSSTEYAAIMSQKEMDLSIALTGPIIGGIVAHALTIHIPRCTFKAVKLGDKNGIVTFQLTFTPLWDAASGKIYEVTLVNNTASYAA